MATAMGARQSAADGGKQHMSAGDNGRGARAAVRMEPTTRAYTEPKEAAGRLYGDSERGGPERCGKCRMGDQRARARRGNTCDKS
jgi:hypothetical protein